MSRSLFEILEEIFPGQEPTCANLPISHVMKSWPDHFQQTRNGFKTFDLRKRKPGRVFSKNSYVIMREWLPENKVYTGRLDVFWVSEVLTVEEQAQFGIETNADALYITKVLSSD